MFGIFNLDSPIGRAMNTVADVMILSVLWVVCSLPVFTAGAATTALYYASMRSVRQEGSVFKDFFRAFRDNFKKSLMFTLLLAGAVLLIAGDFRIFSKVQFAGESVLRVILYAVIFLLIMIVSYFFPLLARYDAAVKAHIKNAFLLSISSPLTTLIVAAMTAAPILLFLIKPVWFFRVLPFITILWVGMAAHINSRILLKLFEKIQPSEENQNA